MRFFIPLVKKKQFKSMINPMGWPTCDWPAFETGVVGRNAAAVAANKVLTRKERTGGKLPSIGNGSDRLRRDHHASGATSSASGATSTGASGATSTGASGATSTGASLLGHSIMVGSLVKFTPRTGSSRQVGGHDDSMSPGDVAVVLANLGHAFLLSSPGSTIESDSIDVTDRDIRLYCA